MSNESSGFSKVGKQPDPRETPVAAVLQSLQIAILVVDSGGRIVSANTHTERLFGYDPTELVGMAVEKLVPANLRKGHEEHRKAYTKSPDARQMGAGRDLMALRKDGVEVPVEIGLSPLRGPDEHLILVSIIDISERKKAEAAVHERDRLLRAIMDNSSAVIYMKDLQGRYLMVNRQYEEVFGVKNQAITGKTDRAIFPPEVADRFAANDVEVISTRSPRQFEEVAPQPDGPHEYVSTKFPLLTPSGEVYGMCGISTDVTEVRRMQRELSHAEKLTALGQLAAGVAHEINTPLANILLVTESLLRRSTDPAVRTKLQTIIDQVETSSRIVKGLLDFARKKEPVFGRVDVVQTVRDTIMFIRGKAPADVEFLVEAPEEVVEVEGDGSQLTQVFANIVLNAIDAMGGRGRVTIRVSNAEDEDGPEQVEVVFDDEGPGLPDDIRARVFEPFFSTKTGTGGTGLGLSVAYGIVRAHGGEIETENREPRGARFRVRLPRVGGRSASG